MMLRHARRQRKAAIHLGSATPALRYEEPIGRKAQQEVSTNRYWRRVKRRAGQRGQYRAPGHHGDALQ